MSHYKALGLEKEPFSTSPDPDFFYHSDSHNTALKRLEISIRLRRGLCLILGDVGTGKTTLSRTLLQAFQGESDFIFHMILDPSFKSEFQFLLYLVKMFGIEPPFRSTLDFKEALEKYLFQKGAEDNKTIILLIDEGQKITQENLEVLRMLLNYETNEYKLLQLVILSQVEVLPRIKRIRNFMDRVALKYTINPLDEMETKEMIEFRLLQARPTRQTEVGLDDVQSGAAGYHNQRILFTNEAIRLIYQHTQGYPRKISMLCHDALEALVMRDALVVDKDIVGSLISQRQVYEPNSYSQEFGEPRIL